MPPRARMAAPLAPTRAPVSARRRPPARWPISVAAAPAEPGARRGASRSSCQRTGSSSWTPRGHSRGTSVGRSSAKSHRGASRAAAKSVMMPAIEKIASICRSSRSPASGAPVDLQPRSATSRTPPAGIRSTTGQTSGSETPSNDDPRATNPARRSGRATPRARSGSGWPASVELGPVVVWSPEDAPGAVDEASAVAAQDPAELAAPAAARSGGSQPPGGPARLGLAPAEVGRLVHLGQRQESVQARQRPWCVARPSIRSAAPRPRTHGRRPHRHARGRARGGRRRPRSSTAGCPCGWSVG